MRYLVVDDHALIREAMHGVLRALDAEASVLSAGTGAQARRTLAAEPGIDLTLLDLRLPDADGLELLAEFRQSWPTMAVVMLSGERDATTVRQALDVGAGGSKVVDLPSRKMRDQGQWPAVLNLEQGLGHHSVLTAMRCHGGHEP